MNGLSLENRDQSNTEENSVQEQRSLSGDQELENCQFCKMILMVLIVFYHSILFWSGIWFPFAPVEKISWVSTLSEWLNSFHLYGFALISGYVFAAMEERGKYQQYGPFLARKAKRLLIPYFFVGLLWVVPITNLFFPDSFDSIVDKMILAVSPGHLWFLWMLFDVFAISWPLYHIRKQYPAAVIALIGFFYVLSIFGWGIFPDYFCIWKALEYLPVFWMGILLRNRKGKFWDRIPVLGWVLIQVLLFQLLDLLSNRSYLAVRMFAMGLEPVVHVVGALMAFFVLQKAARGIGQKAKDFLQEPFKKYAFPIYLLHQQIIYLALWGFYGKINPYMHMALNFTIALGVSMLITELLMRFKFTRFLMDMEG